MVYNAVFLFLVTFVWFCMSDKETDSDPGKLSSMSMVTLLVSGRVCKVPLKFRI